MFLESTVSALAAVCVVGESFSQRLWTERKSTNLETTVATETERLVPIPTSTIGKEIRRSCGLRFSEWFPDPKRVVRRWIVQKSACLPESTTREKPKQAERVDTSIGHATFSVARKSYLLWPLPIPLRLPAPNWPKWQNYQESLSDPVDNPCIGAAHSRFLNSFSRTSANLRKACSTSTSAIRIGGESP